MLVQITDTTHSNKWNKDLKARPLGHTLTAILLYLFPIPMFAGDTSAVPTPKVIRLEPKGKSYLKLLGGLPESYGMRSGLVTLKPGESVGEHNTEEYEEIIITLKGEGEMRITGEESLRVNEKVVLYCPPHTEHDVFNVGKKLLQYIYVVSKAPK